MTTAAPEKVTVNVTQAHIDDGQRTLNGDTNLQLPPEAHEFIDATDDRRPVQPFTFEAEVVQP